MTAGKKPIVGAIAAIATGALVLAAMGLGSRYFRQQCPSGQTSRDGACVSTSDPTPAEQTAPADTNGNSPPASTSVYRRFSEVPNVPKMTVLYGGSTSFAPLRSPQIVNKILKAHPSFKLVYTEPPLGSKPGSGSGIRMLLDGQLSVAQSSRELSDEEFARAKERNVSLEQIPIAIDGIALYVNPKLALPGLTLSQIKDIFTGKVTNWKQVGGPDVDIKPISRNPSDGGTPEFFQDTLLGGELYSQSTLPFAPNTTASLQRVARTLGGIGYATASEVCQQSSIQPLAIARASDQAFISPCNGTTVNTAVFADGTYAIARRLFVIVKRDGGLDEQAGRAYANLLLSDEGQQIVESAGLAPIRLP